MCYLRSWSSDVLNGSRGTKIKVLVELVPSEFHGVYPFSHLSLFLEAEPRRAGASVSSWLFSDRRRRPEQFGMHRMEWREDGLDWKHPAFSHMDFAFQLYHDAVAITASLQCFLCEMGMKLAVVYQASLHVIWIFKNPHFVVCLSWTSGTTPCFPVGETKANENG